MQQTVQMKTQKEENTKRKIERKKTNYKEFKKIRYHLAKYEEGMACSLKKKKHRGATYHLAPIAKLLRSLLFSLSYTSKCSE